MPSLYSFFYQIGFSEPDISRPPVFKTRKHSFQRGFTSGIKQLEHGLIIRSNDSYLLPFIRDVKI
jgi:hypothetical protein